jgi:hypothetical protein
MPTAVVVLHLRNWLWETYINNGIVWYTMRLGRKAVSFRSQSRDIRLLKLRCEVNRQIQLHR